MLGAETVAYYLGGYACYDGVWWYIAGYYCSCCYYGAIADGASAHYSHVVAYPHVVTYNGCIAVYAEYFGVQQLVGECSAALFVWAEEYGVCRHECVGGVARVYYRYVAADGAKSSYTTSFELAIEPYVCGIAECGVFYRRAGVYDVIAFALCVAVEIGVLVYDHMAFFEPCEFNFATYVFDD